jgi:hypothetical protein
MKKHEFRHDLISRMKEKQNIEDIGISELIGTDFQDYLTSRIWRISENEKNYFTGIMKRFYTQNIKKLKHKKEYLQAREKALSLFYPHIQKI